MYAAGWWTLLDTARQALRPHSSISPLFPFVSSPFLLCHRNTLAPLRLCHSSDAPLLCFVTINIDVTSSQCQYVIAEC